MAEGRRKQRNADKAAALRPAKRASAPKAATPRSVGTAGTRLGSPGKRMPVTKAIAAAKKKVAKKKVAKKNISPVMPYLTVDDMVASLAFYEQALGFKRGEVLSLPDGSLIQVTMHHSGAAAFKFSPEGNCSGSMRAPASSRVESPIVMYVPCRKVDVLIERARAAGASIATEPEDMFWGERTARIVDPDGYVWSFAAKIGKFDPNNIPQAVEKIDPPESLSPMTEDIEVVPQEEQSSGVDFEL
ncbi:MAG: VOC family protein [Burkholderiales bacterium]